LLQRLAQGNPSALSVTAADFFQDGTKTLVTGYALGSGGVVSVQDGLQMLPRVEEMATKPAFQSDANYIDLGIRPDFLKSADVNGDAHQDLIVASRGGTSIQVLLGDGHGNFTLRAPIPVKGQITALTPIRSVTGQRLIAVGVCGQSCSVNLIQSDGTLVAAVPVDDKITILEAARFNGTPSEDLIAGGSSNLVLIDGQTALTTSPRIDRLPVSGAVSAITGSFVYDARGYRQIAVLTNDGSLHTLARSGIIAQPPVPVANRRLAYSHQRPRTTLPDPSTLSWTEVETLNNIAQFNTEGTPTLLWSRVASSGMDNVLILNVNGGAITTVLHQVVLYPSTGPGVPSSMKALPAKVEVEPSSSGTIAGAIAIRTAQDSRLGLVLARSKPTPELDGPFGTGNTTYIYVGTAADPSTGVTTASLNSCRSSSSPSSINSSCTLRSALALSDADASSNESDGKVDTVYVQNGTYTLGDYGPETANSGAVGQPDQYGNTQYHIEIYGPTNLVGTGTAANTTITTNNNDQIFGENSGNELADPNSYQPPIDFYMSGLTLSNGDLSDATFQDIQNNGEQVYDGGLISADTGEAGYITFSNDVFQNGTAPGGSGGAVDITDDGIGFGANGAGGNGNGVFEATNCTFTGNLAEETGGAVLINQYVPATFSGDTFHENGIVPLSQDNAAPGQGGAIAFVGDDVANAPETTVTTSTFTNNYGTASSATIAADEYSQGGAIYSPDPIEISDSTFTGNSSGNSGGAIYMVGEHTTGFPTFTGSILGTVITGNTSDYGGGIDVEAQSDGSTTGLHVAIQYNAIYGNTASSNANTSGLALGYSFGGETSANATTTATENFWGCNTGANTSGCDSAAAQSTEGGTLTLTPYAVVTATLNSTSITQGSQVTITGYLDSDSNGNTLSNLVAFEGLPASISISVGGSSIASSTPTTNSSASASLSANPSSSGSGVATFSIHNATVTKNFTVSAPAPTANNQSVSVAYDSSVGITLTASGQGTLTYAIVTSPSHGTISNFSSSAGTLTYQASVGYVGADSFTFTASNGTTSNVATVSITISPIQPSISLSAPTTANRGTASALVATLTIPSGAPTPTASVNFYAGGTNLIGSAGLMQTSSTTYAATYNAANLPPGQQTLTASYPGDADYLSATSTGQSTFVIANYIWVGNQGGTTSAFDPLGTPYLSTPEPDGGFGIAIDSGGNVWSVNANSNSIAEFSETGTLINAGYTGGGLSTPAAVAIDGSGRVWITNLNNSVSVFNASGQPVSSSAYTGTTSGSATHPLNTPTSISIDGSGNLWIANSGNNTVTEILGAATPTIAPIASGVANNNPASMP
jgi:predicted outer membrane repeat protein